jgi:hypothetical protein
VEITYFVMHMNIQTKQFVLLQLKLDQSGLLKQNHVLAPTASTSSASLRPVTISPASTKKDPEPDLMIFD